MTPLDATLAELAELERRATPGPWLVDGNVDTKLAAALRNALPAILADRSRLVKERDYEQRLIASVLDALYAATHDTQTHDLADIGKRVAALAKERDEAIHRDALSRAEVLRYREDLCACLPPTMVALFGEIDRLTAARDTAIADLAKARGEVNDDAALLQLYAQLLVVVDEDDRSDCDKAVGKMIKYGETDTRCDACVLRLWLHEAERAIRERGRALRALGALAAAVGKAGA